MTRADHLAAIRVLDEHARARRAAVRRALLEALAIRGRARSAELAEHFGARKPDAINRVNGMLRAFERKGLVRSMREGGAVFWERVTQSEAA